MDVKSVRDKIRTILPTAKLKITFDNMIYVRETTDKVVWDDAKGLIYILKSNEDHRDSANQLELQVMSYENIIIIEVDTPPGDFKVLTKAFGFTDADINEFVTNLTTIKL